MASSGLWPSPRIEFRCGLLSCHLGRVCLSMEVSVGLMLIVLGVMNHTGMLQWIHSNILASPVREGMLYSHTHSLGNYIHANVYGHCPQRRSNNPEDTRLNWFD